MKNLATFVLSFFICISGFPQLMGKSHFDNNQDVGGDAVIKSSSVRVERDEICKTFEVESQEAGVYYMDAWIVAPFTMEGYPEYKVAVNGVLSDLTFKPQIDGWHSLALTDAKKSIIAVNLKKGENIISIIGKGPEVPNVEFIKLSLNLSRTGISDSKYRAFIESVKNNTLNEAYYIDSKQSSSNRSTNGEIYDYVLYEIYHYTTYKTFSLSSGTNMNITAGSSFLPCVIELFNMTNPGSYWWSANPTAGSTNLNITIPAGGGGDYLLLVRSFEPWNMGMTTLTINGSTYNNSFISYSRKIEVTPGYNTPANFFTCKIMDGGNTWLFLRDNSERIRAFNGNGGVTSDGYSWENASRITTNLTNISYGQIFAVNSYYNMFICDLYMGLEAAHSYVVDLFSYFPNLQADNSFKSGTETGEILNLAKKPGYNCIDWSIGISADSGVYVPGNWRFYYTLKDWDDFYGYYGYTRSEADSANAAIALWVTYWGSDFKHASVRKNSVITEPHGFEWESKIGDLERIMHTRDALDNGIYGIYGNITYYYKPISGTVNSPPVNKTGNDQTVSRFSSNESCFTAFELNKISELKDYIPAIVLLGFDTKYLAWRDTWRRPEIAIHSDPCEYSKSEEYNNLFNYCTKYGKSIWPLLFEKLENGDIFVISLLRDLTYSGNGTFVIDIMPSSTARIGKPFPSLYSILVDYCKKLLAKEQENILQSINDISAILKESFEVNITVSNSQEVLINLDSDKDTQINIKVYNVFGQLEYKVNYPVLKGNQTVLINASNLKKGIYVLQITKGDKLKSQIISFI